MAVHEMAGTEAVSERARPALPFEIPVPAHQRRLLPQLLLDTASRFSCIGIFRSAPMISMGAHERTPPPRELIMHDLIIALAFIGMVIAPAVVAAKSSQASDDPD